MVCRRITGSELGAFLCGLLYGFGAYMQAQSLAHAHLALAVFPPFALLMVHELAVEQRRPAGRVGALLGLGCVAQLLTGEELLATTIVLAGLLVVVLALMYRDQIRRRAAHLLRGLGAAAAVGAVLGGPVVAYELFGPRHVNSLLQQRNTYVADLAGFIVPTRLEWLSTAGARELSAKFTGFSGEYSVYLGAPLLLIVGFAAWRLRSQPAARVASFMAAASALLSLGSFLHVFGHRTRIPMPWLPLSHVPLMESAAPDRLALFTALAVGVLVALLIRDLAQTRARVRLVSWGAIAVAVVAIVPNVPAPVASLDVPRFFESRSVSMIPAGTIAVVFPRQSGSYLAMAAQIRSKFRFRLAQGGVFTPEGFDSASSSVYELLIAAEERRPPRGSAAACVQVDQGISDRCRRIVAADLRRRQVGAVIIMNASGAGAISELFSSYFGRPPINAGGVRLWLLRTAQEQTHPPSTAAR
jgi:hypothetical protein